MTTVLEITAAQLLSAAECAEPDRHAADAMLVKDGDALILHQGSLRLSFRPTARPVASSRRPPSAPPRSSAFNRLTVTAVRVHGRPRTSSRK